MTGQRIPAAGSDGVPERPSGGPHVDAAGSDQPSRTGAEPTPPVHDHQPRQASRTASGAKPAARSGAERNLAPVSNPERPRPTKAKGVSLLSAEAIDEELEKLRVSSKVRKRQLKELRKAGAMLGDVLARGFLTAYLLHLCEERPRHGNEILHEIEARTDGLWTPSSGGVYTVLRKLEKRGLLEGNWEAGVTRDRRVYRVTDAGRDALEEFRGLAPPRIAAASRVLEIVAKDLLEGPTRR